MYVVKQSKKNMKKKIPNSMRLFCNLIAPLDAHRRKKARDISREYVFFNPWVIKALFQNKKNKRKFSENSRKISKWNKIPNSMWLFCDLITPLDALWRKKAWYLAWLCFLHSLSHQSAFSKKKKSQKILGKSQQQKKSQTRCDCFEIWSLHWMRPEEIKLVISRMTMFSSIPESQKHLFKIKK
jgi:hypothetical protein